MAHTRASRHLGIDLGVTNTKWAVTECEGGAWRALATGQGRTPAADGPAAVIGMLGTMGRGVMTEWAAIESVLRADKCKFDPDIDQGEDTALLNQRALAAGLLTNAAF